MIATFGPKQRQYASHLRHAAVRRTRIVDQQFRQSRIDYMPELGSRSLDDLLHCQFIHRRQRDEDFFVPPASSR